MTTAVVVKALHGHDVSVTRVDTETDAVSSEMIVIKGTEQTFYVWKGSDLIIHEVEEEKSE
ncbi:hypothetical protein EVB91_130 [Rhizobium phage RHph_I1_18]|nr:hypothetical protein EVB91_130 [Rhizobium phage RHph_I1_18]